MHETTAASPVEPDERRALRDAYAEMQRPGAVFRVSTVIRPGIRESRVYRIHPLAMALPPLPEEEFLQMAADMKQHGVVTPLTVTASQVLDGRHRLAIASVLWLPVRTTHFNGSDDTARDVVFSLNVRRRHMTVAQRGQLVRQWYLPQARSLAGAAGDDEIRAIELAVQRSGGMATVRTVHAMGPVDDAPQTQAAIRAGEIKTSAEARRRALAETGSPEPKRPRVAQPRSAYDRLGCALGDLRSAQKSMETNRGNATGEEFAARVAQIRELLESF